MQEADDETYASYPESIRIVAMTGAHPQIELLGVSDHPDADVPGLDQFVRYIRADESDLHGFVPEHWQQDTLTLRRLLEARQLQFLHAMEELQEALDYNARSTRDRLQRIRGIVQRQRETWAGRSATFGKKDLDDPEDMV